MPKSENITSIPKNIVKTRSLHSMIEFQLDALAADPSLAHSLPPIMIWGAPGIGKSTIIKNIAKDRGIGFIDVRLAQREPIDIRGLPVPEGDGVKWLVSSEWPRDPNSKGIILFDEITAADRSLQVAAYEFILDRRLGDLYSVPDGWYIIAAGNRVEDRAVSTTMSSALANRFLHVELMEDAEEWTKWASASGVHPNVVGFIRYKPNYLFSTENENLERGWPSPRSWERVSTMLKLADAAGTPKEMVKAMICGLVGIAAGSEFMAFAKNRTTLENTVIYLDDPNVDPVVPEEIDQKYVMATSAVYYLWNDASKTDARLAGFFNICNKMSADFGAMMVSDAMAGKNGVDKAKMAKLAKTPGYRTWSEKHGKALKKYL